MDIRGWLNFFKFREGHCRGLREWLPCVANALTADALLVLGLRCVSGGGPSFLRDFGGDGNLFFDACTSEDSGVREMIPEKEFVLISLF